MDSVISGANILGMERFGQECRVTVGTVAERIGYPTYCGNTWIGTESSGL